jgi:hypothetical protein
MYEGFNIKEWLIPKNQWTNPDEFIDPDGMVIHWTGNINEGADAEANSRFFHDRTGTYGSAHYCLDDKINYRNLRENQMGYHVGATKYYTTKFGTYPNRKLLGLEICVNMDTDWAKTYDHAVRFTAAVCKARKWTKASAVLVRHYDVTRKDCPLMWTPFISDAAHVRSSVISMLFPKKSTETAADYKARLAKNEPKIQAGIKWVNSMTAKGKLGDAGWTQFLTDVQAEIDGVPNKTIPEKVEYFMGKYFTDVDDKTWQGQAVNALHELELKGGQTLFGGSQDAKGKLVARPNDPITRAETAALILRATQYAVEQIKK